MKQQHSEHKKTPSSFCRFLLFILTLKLSVIFIFFLEFSLALFGDSQTLLDYVLPKQQKSIAIAASAPGAPPAIKPELAPNTGANVNNTTPNAASANTQAPQGLPPQARALPLIGDNATARQENLAADSLTRDMLSKKQEDLARKEQELKTLEEQLNDKLTNLTALENRLSIMMQEADAKEDAKTKHLVDVLTNMKAKAAAQVLETMDPRVAVKVLALMAGRQAGEILGFMQPATAASLGTALTRMQLPLP